MDLSVLEKSALFAGIPAAELREDLAAAPHRIQCYDRDETVFQLMDEANRIGVILEGRIQAQKTFPNGSQVNVSVKGPGEVIGAAAAFSRSRRYPCGMAAVGPAVILMFRREELLSLMQKDVRILENLTMEIASATYTLSQRLELLSYNAIAQKAAFWLLMQARQTGGSQVRIPGSVSKWALLMNVSRPSLHRELRRLEAEGMIAYAPPVIRILNEAALQEVLSE